jgi:hypothetical protein
MTVPWWQHGGANDGYDGDSGDYDGHGIKTAAAAAILAMVTVVMEIAWMDGVCSTLQNHSNNNGSTRTRNRVACVVARLQTTLAFALNWSIANWSIVKVKTACLLRVCFCTHIQYVYLLLFKCVIQYVYLLRAHPLPYLHAGRVRQPAEREDDA